MSVFELMVTLGLVTLMASGAAFGLNASIVLLAPTEFDLPPKMESTLHGDVSKEQTSQPSEKSTHVCGGVSQIELIATVVADHRSALLIEDRDMDRVVNCRVGSVIHGAEVLHIERGRVTLVRDGSFEFLTMEGNHGDGETVAGGFEDDWGIRQVGERHYVVPREIIVGHTNDISCIDHGRVLPHLGPSGEVDGVRLSGLRRGSLLVRLGLKNGDIVYTLNGHSLMDTSPWANSSPDSIWLEITRGQPMTFLYEMR